MRRRGAAGFLITELPYRVKVYSNFQVLIPASLVRVLDIANLRYANITFRFNNITETIEGARLLRTRHTDSRQFTIPKELRERYGIRPGDYIEIISIKPI
ncbi:AbrB/MazE/SpoVT family DNA-binding domain-containing protein [Caldivirga sp. UBA161]|uniref:AbrB/MazE/SpoVT family DNA-binding domain-containing protein n=1 Tax=Caldivirga sp. UBA161 TaxID=1915569 RepID=UPI0025BE2990|nr:AbrB/MazE/SpoVT family DNA-binding domain-containing protein [Caldivirga sp. UBA161]